jgi:glycogen synthase
MPEKKLRRVLMTGDTVGGVWTFTLELAEALGARNVEVVLAALGGRPSREQMAEAARIPNLCLLTSDFKLEWMDDPWRDVEESGQWLLALEREYGPDIVHLNSFGHGALPWKMPVILTAHSCVLSWWEAVRGGSAPASWDRYRELAAQSLRTADLVTTPSRAMAAALRRHYGSSAAPYQVIYNGRSNGYFRRGDKKQLILTAGRLWDEAKNIAAVARIAARLPWPVFAAGDARHPDGTETRFEGCRMFGRLSSAALAEWYARAPIYVLPARYEPFGLTAVEAALSGCALILGDIDSLREIWDGAALFVPLDDELALIAALQTLIDDRQLRESLAASGYERAMTFDAARMARGYLAAYTSQTRRQQCVS